MAGPTFYDMGDPEVVLQWERKVLAAAAKRNALLNKKLGFIGEAETSLIQRKKEVYKRGGTRATFILSRQLRQLPSFGQQTLREREEGLDTSTYNLDINQVRHAVAVQGIRITKQRVPFDVWEESISKMGEFWPQVMSAGMFAHLCGVQYDVSTVGEWYHRGDQLGVTFSNTPRAPDTKHILRVNDHANDQTVATDPTAILDIHIGSKLKAIAKMLPVPIRPALIHGQELYVLFVHPYQVAHLKDNSRWLSRMRDTLKGGGISADHPLVTGALGIDDGVLWVEDPYVFPGVNSSTNARVADCRRAVFCGAQAGFIGLAKQYEDESTFTNDEENWDYRNNKGISATILAGFGAPYFVLNDQGTTEDFGKIVVSSYAKELVTSA